MPAFGDRLPDQIYCARCDCCCPATLEQETPRIGVAACCRCGKRLRVYPLRPKDHEGDLLAWLGMRIEAENAANP